MYINMFLSHTKASLGTVYVNHNRFFIYGLVCLCVGMFACVRAYVGACFSVEDRVKTFCNYTISVTYISDSPR